MGLFSWLSGKSPEERESARRAEAEAAFPWLGAARQRAEIRPMDGPGSAALTEEKDEALANNIKRLLLSASFQESRDPRAFNHLSGQLQEMGKAIAASGLERWNRIRLRVTFLSGEHYAGLARFYDLLGGTPIASAAPPPAAPEKTVQEQLAEAGVDPVKAAGDLGLQFLQVFEGGLYARDKTTLYSIGLLRQSEPRVAKEVHAQDGYVGEEYHSPRQGAEHAGWTVIEEKSARPEDPVDALDGFGRKFRVDRTGNGPIASLIGFASDEEIRTWAPKHRPRRRTVT